MDLKEKRIPRWFLGVTVCFAIFLVSQIYLGAGLENALKTDPDGNVDLGYDILSLGILFIVIPLVFLIFVLASFFQRKRVQQLRSRYIILTIILIVIGMGFIYLLPYLFPATYESNAQACATLKSSVLAARCYERNAKREKDPSLCDKMYINEPKAQWYRNSCRENVQRGHW